MIGTQPLVSGGLILLALGLAVYGLMRLNMVKSRRLEPGAAQDPKPRPPRPAVKPASRRAPVAPPPKDTAPVPKRSRAQKERHDFHAMPPVLSGWPPGFECKRLERTPDGWDVYWGRVDSPSSISTARLHPRSTGFTVNGGMVVVNGGRLRR